MDRSSNDFLSRQDVGILEEAVQKYRNLEIEAKFASFQKDLRHDFFRLTNRFPIKLDTTERSIVQINGEVRQIQTLSHVGREAEVHYEEKKRLNTLMIQPYQIKIALAVEIPVTSFSISKGSSVDRKPIFRYRERSSFPISPVSRLDLTILYDDDTFSNQIGYEVELEFTGKTGADLKGWISDLPIIFRALHGTNETYTRQARNRVDQTVGSLLHTDLRSKGPSRIRKRDLVTSRNIKAKDLVSGGIVPAAYPKGTPNSSVSYTVTYKADGVRHLLIISDTGIWLINPPNDYNLLLAPSRGISPFLSNYRTTVFDGELIDRPDSPKGYYYLVFDTLIMKDRDVRTLTYLQRLNLLRYLLQDLIPIHHITDLIKITGKRTAKTDIHTFFPLVNQFLDAAGDLPYQTDGLIFTPNEAPYFLPASLLDPSRRDLTRAPDICKWKPPKDITIDFTVYRSEELTYKSSVKYLLGSYDPDQKKDVIFQGDQRNPLTEDLLDFSTFPDIPDGAVVEFEWFLRPSPEGTGYPSKIVLRPRKFRPDKLSGNRLSVALDNWRDIFDPITEDDLRGRTIRFVRTYHNKVKERLYAFIHQKFPTGLALLDIGTGRGGDIEKWRLLGPRSVIIGVEPNGSNRAECLARLDRKKNLIQETPDKRYFNRLTGKMEPDFCPDLKVVQTGGEDTTGIVQTIRTYIQDEKVDVVTSMLSLSFFFQSDDFLDRLVQTLVATVKPGGYFIFFTIDGATLSELLHPVFLRSDRTWVNEINVADVTFRLEGKNGVNVVIPGTIVEDQHEFLVDLSRLAGKLRPYGFLLGEVRRAEDEPFLSPDAKVYSSLYSYGYFIHDGTTPLVDLPDDLEPIDLVINRSDDEGNDVFTDDDPVQNFGNLNLRSIDTELFHATELETPLQEFISSDDQVTEISPPEIYDGMVRIGTIPDGNCFIHAVLKGFYRKYQDATRGDRTMLAEGFRRDLAYWIGLPSEKYPDFTNYETVGNGMFIQHLLLDLQNPLLVKELGIDYSLSGIQHLFNSRRALGDEIYPVIADLINFDIFIFRFHPDQPGLIKHEDTRVAGVYRPCLLILHLSHHYELLGRQTEDGIQTIFTSNDPFLRRLLQNLYPVDYQVTRISFDPTDQYIRLILETFRSNNSKMVDIPADLISFVFADDDPFLQTVNRLARQIVETGKKQGLTVQFTS